MVARSLLHAPGGGLWAREFAHLAGSPPIFQLTHTKQVSLDSLAGRNKLRATMYTFDFWRKYTRSVRGLARRSGCSMREVDRALWQYSKERQDRL
jgi:hypothetical protein